MKKRIGENLEIADANEEKDKIVSIEIGKCYQFKPDEFQIDVSSVHYANHSFIQVMTQDIFIDFLTIPGTKKDGKMVADATRIFMTHVQAKKLVESLGAVLESTYQAGRMETYSPKK